ncbi:MAG: amino acid adenylation domain-containing protein, partial [Synergistaceae bacterium]|nr:amino acid adenylation domain-containing protein [Synergistaceae bacterium]
VGRPLLNVREYIIDTAGNLAPRGVVGELYIGGPGVALGYRNLPEQTSQRFIEFRGERFYHSGDYAKWNFEGNVQVLGRMDGQVKLRGLRIELGEIEAVLSEQPGVTRAVAAIKLIDGQEHLCAWYTSDKPLNDDELRSALSARLTRYMVPDAFTRLEDIPVNANGKTDLKALPVPELLNQTEDLTPPQDDTQKRIHDIISGILGSTAFGIHSHFYSIGLTSLSMVSLMLKLSEAFNTNITLSDLRSHDTVAALAKHLAVTDNTKSYAVRSEYPLTQTQYGIYIECLNNPDTTIYNIPVLWKLGTGVDINRLKAAVVAALDAHPFIKTRLKNQQGNIIALRNDDMPPEVNFIRTDNDIEPDKLVRPYDLLNDNLYRAEIYATPAGNYFFLDMHHIASDGRSRALIVRDIERVYAGEQIRAEKWTGFDTALLEQEERNGPRYEAAKAWYDSLLSDAVSTELPPVPGSAEGEDVFLKFNTNLEYNAIKSFCDRLRITGNAFFNAVYGYVLAVFAASDEAVFTTIYDGRNDARLMNTVSMLVKTLPVRCKIEPTQTVAEFLTDMRDQLNNSMNSDLYSFAEIARAYGIRADYMVAWQDEISVASVFCGEESEIYRPVLNTAKSALSVDINIEDGKIVFVGEHRTEVFGIDFMRSFLECMTQVAAEFMTRKTLGEICPVSQAGEEALKHFHDTGWPVVQRPAYRLLQDSAHRWPNRVAVVSDSVSLTYEQLNARANRLARVLRDKGVGVEKICAVMLERGVDVYTARQAVLKAGGAFLPIDPEYPDDRVRFILQDSACVCMVTNSSCYKERSGALKHEGLEICFVDEAENDSIDCSDLNIDVPFDALCYTIYTSGSTGQPKGVMLTQRNLVSFVDNNPKNHEILGYVNRGSVSLALASIAFDVSIMEEFIPLANGMTVVMTTEDERHDYIALSKLCLDNKVDIITCTPSMMSNMLNVRQMHPVIKNLKSIDLGAEAFPAALYGEIRALNSDVYIMNGYGPTETTISCTMAVMEGDERITIGIPNSNVKVVMMDTLGHVLPVGALGEMIIIGEGVGRGYINRDDLTARSFIRLWDRPAYRSGDLARLLPDGNIEFRGRTDNQVKLRGLRVELDEIENVMLSYPGVRIASVIVRNNGTEDYLAGFFTGSEKISPEALSNFMRTKLTAYMIPDVLMQLDEMPLTSNGKIDKKKLPDIRFERPLNEYVAPASDLEKIFCDKFADILKLDRVGATDSFFEIGGTSLSAMILVAFAVGQGW